MKLVTSDILHQLDILSAKDVAEEGESVILKCRVQEMGKHNDISVNLYKNGEKVQIKPSAEEMGLVTFKLENIRQEQTGNYICLYEEKTTENMTHIKEKNFLSLTVKPSVLTLQAEKKKSVQGGLDVIFKCFFPKGKKAQNPPNAFHLYENGIKIMSKSVGNKLGAEFTVKNVNETSDATYICKYREQGGFTIQSQQYGLQDRASDQKTEGNSSEGANNMILYSILEHKKTSTKMPTDVDKVVYAKLGPQIKTQNSPVDPENAESA
ncbi:uncharacterized protein LOC114663230 [Erpetoichthys calabaricus]|uniref:uncharacterized protein LOC114663230 n=1 Tax=Erpetoichthys calabaricus TaxID=27687 RepID=UPI002234E6B0|nr:uncharacterized protein LOC114663230 [Erpetoichthys calabaricus]